MALIPFTGGCHVHFDYMSWPSEQELNGGSDLKAAPLLSAYQIGEVLPVAQPEGVKCVKFHPAPMLEPNFDSSYQVPQSLIAKFSENKQRISFRRHMPVLQGPIAGRRGSTPGSIGPIQGPRRVVQK